MSELRTHGWSRRRFLTTAATFAGAAAVGGAGAVFGGAGATLAAVTITTRKLDNRDPSIVYSPPANWREWNSQPNPKWFMGTARSSLTPNTYFEYTGVQCNRLKWWATKSTSRGIADVYLDGVKVASVNQYASTEVATAVCWDSGELTPGRHTLRVVVTGQKTPAAVGAWVECDAIEVADVDSMVLDIDDSSQAIYYTGPLNNWIAYVNHPGIPTRFMKTCHFAQKPDCSFSYTHRLCSRITWLATLRRDGGLADVFIDGVAAGTVDLYSATSIDNSVIFDSGLLTPGSHTIKVVAKGTARQGSSGTVVEVDRLRVTAVPDEFERVNDDNATIIGYSGEWEVVTGQTGAANGDIHRIALAGSAADFGFDSPQARWIGSMGPDHGIADILLDGTVVASVDCYSPTAVPSAVLYQTPVLPTATTHLLRVLVSGRTSPLSAGTVIGVDAFECASARSFVGPNYTLAVAELKTVAAWTKPFVAPATWVPVPYVATSPQSGVRLLAAGDGSDGPLKTAFGRNLNYLQHSFSCDHYIDDSLRAWAGRWPASNEGRMLMGAGHALRWMDPSSSAAASMRAIVDTVMATIVAREQSTGFGLPWPASEMPDRVQVERAGYDRAMWVRGLVAAIACGHPDAPAVLRRHADWFNGFCRNNVGATTVGALYGYSLGIQGHIASTLAYHSPVGVTDDIVMADRSYVQEWWMQWLARREPTAIWRYPHNRPHSYLLIGGEAFLDHYRATGATKFLDASLGMWDIFRQYFLFPGGGTAISEANAYEPNSQYVHIANNEFDGAIFWAQLNARLLQLYPNDERYANEIERAIYNTALAQQRFTNVAATFPAGATVDYGPYPAGSGIARETIRYHAQLDGRKDRGGIYNSCCEVNGTGFYSRLPEFIYSVAADGIFVNLFESSSIDCTVAGSPITLTTSTRFPYDMAVSHTLQIDAPVAMSLRIRVPAWATAAVSISVNGQVAASGAAGSYAVLTRTWSDGDTVTYTLPAGFRLTRYTGQNQVASGNRYALEFGPVLFAAVSGFGTPVVDQFGSAVRPLPVAASALLGALQATTTPLEFTVSGQPAIRFRPYWKVEQELMTAFPLLQ